MIPVFNTIGVNVTGFGPVTEQETVTGLTDQSIGPAPKFLTVAVTYSVEV